MVIEPGVAVPTAKIFTSEHLTRDTPAVIMSDFSRHLQSFGNAKGFGKNDLQQVATRQDAEALLRKLQADPALGAAQGRVEGA